MGNAWSPRHTLDDSERARLAILNARPAPNPPELLREVTVRVLRPFFVAGVCREVGETVKVQEYVAVDLVFLKKAERCEIP